ncbi:MAG: hypothetical protein QNL90_00765 [Gammaproteobacteria bacterium]|jgi:hypothetical protein|nr:hypothetical protein [Gammaproteobacteria bacterium]MDX2458591.1 hypothetical protein [Gammaproteobacteria bacterium]
MHRVYSRSTLLFFLGVLGAGFFAVYAPELHGPFLLDDYPSIVTNKLIAVDTLDGEGLRDAAFSLGDSRYPHRGIVRSSFALNHNFSSAARQ